MTIKVSVVIPAYNHEKYIASSVESAVNQSFNPLEIIIINDGSTDNTGVICRKMSAEQPFVRLIEQENQGAHNAP